MSIKITAPNFRFKLVPHKTDPNMIVVKARHPEVGAMIAHVAGISTLGVDKGAVYFLTFLPRAEVEAKIGEIVMAVYAGNLVVQSPSSPLFLGAGDPPEEDDEEEDDEEEED